MSEQNRVDELLAVAEHFSLRDLEILGEHVGRMLRDARAKEKRRIGTAKPEELLPAWGCYNSVPDENLNSKGIDLINAIRSEGGDKISTAMRILRETQLLHARHGADDTEGREAIWDLVQKACVGTTFDPDKFWDKYYE